MSRFDRFFWLTLGLLAAVHLAWMVTLPFWPFTDLPNHLAVASLYRQGEATEALLGGAVRLDRLFQPNTFFPWLCSLPLFGDVQQGARCFYGLYVLLLPLSVWGLLRRLQGDGRAAALAFPLLYHYSVTWGFVGYTASLPAFCAAWTCLLAWEQTGLRRHLAALAGLLGLLFFLHGQTALFTLFFLGLHSLWRHRSKPRRLLAPAAAAAPLLLLLGAWLSWGGGFCPASQTEGLLVAYYLGGAYLAAWPQRLLDLVTLDNRALYSGSAGLAAAAACFGVLAALAARGLRHRSRPWHGSRLASVWLLLCLALGGVLVLPREIDGHGIIYERFAVFVLLALVLLAGAGSRRPLPRRLAPLLLAVALVHGAAWSEYFLSFRQDSASFSPAALLPRAGEGVVAPMLYDNAFRGRPVYLHFANYQTVAHGALPVNAFVDYRFGTIRRQVPEDVLPRYEEWIAWRWDYADLYPQVPWLLVRGEVPPRAEGFFAQYHLERQQSGWQLYRKN